LRESFTGNPSAPFGPEAVQAWRALDRGVRRRLRNGVPADDPETAFVAVGYARTVQSRSLFHRAWPIFLTVVVAGAVAGLLPGNPLSAFTLGAVLAGAAVLGVRPLVRRRVLRLMTMENVNARLLPAPQIPAFGEAPAALTLPDTTNGGSLVARYSTAALVRLYGAAIAVNLALPTLAGVGTGDVTAALVVTACSGVALLWMAYATIRWGRPWLPAVVLDAQGVWLPAPGVRLPWAEVTEIRITPLHTGKGRARPVVSFVVADPQAALAGWRGPHLKRARRSVTVHGTPFSVDAVLLDKTDLDIVATARAFTTAPVRQLSADTSPPPPITANALKST
jgi:hypothetical protein